MKAINVIFSSKRSISYMMSMLLSSIRKRLAVLKPSSLISTRMAAYMSYVSWKRVSLVVD